MSASAGRKPANIALDNRQIIWDALRAEAAKGGASVSLSALIDRTKVNRKTASDYLVCLVAGGYVERIDLETLGCPVFRLIRDGGHHAPRLRKDGAAVTQGAGVNNLWRSMRMLKKFSVLDLALHSSTPAVNVSEATAQSYCSMLLATGFLRVIQKADPAKGRKAIYRLIREDGAKAPMIQRVKQVYDPNTGLIYRKDCDQ